MTEVFPNYYKKFKCIADRCRHSCCIGWEIDIDDETMELYRSLEGSLGKRIRANIAADPPHFVLKEGDRCPFLAADGLCDIIREYGEDGLCDICHLHPRFRNFYDDFTETGLGLCCEEAVRLILTDTEKFSVPLPELAKNDEFFLERQKVFDILQDRSRSFRERILGLCEKYRLSFEFSKDELYDFYMSLERLDRAWESELFKLKRAGSSSVTEVLLRQDLQLLLEQLSCYFVFRHFDKGIGFTLVSLWVLCAIFSFCEGEDKILDVVRMYSCEIEYSEENTQRVAGFIG